MYKFTEAPKHVYHESPQKNNLRWQVLFRDGDTFHPQTAVFRCKDYLNDVVAKYYNWNVIAYGLNNENMKLNEEGVWLELTGIYDMPIFLHNLETCIQPEIVDTSLEYEEIDGGLLMFVPRFFFKNTYFISLLSYMIRVSNCETKFKSYEGLFTSLEAKADRACVDSGKLIAINWKFSLPEELSKYWLYYQRSQNSNTLIELGQGSVIHNCGIMGWAYNLTENQLNWKPAAVAA